MVERLVVGSEAPFFTLNDEINRRTLTFDQTTFNRPQQFLLLYFYSQTNTLQPFEQFCRKQIDSSLLDNAHLWAVLVEDTDDTALIKKDIQTLENQMKENAYQFRLLIDQDAQVAWNYNVYDRETKQGRQAIFLIVPQEHIITTGHTRPIIAHMQIIDPTRGKTTIDWVQLEKHILHLTQTDKSSLINNKYKINFRASIETNVDG